MKNPRKSALAPQRVALQQPNALVIRLEDAKGSAQPKQPDSGLTKALKWLKFSPDEIERITSLVTTVAAVASFVGWVFAAISTVKELLTLIGLLGPAKDPVREILDVVGPKIDAMYKYLAAEDLHVQYAEAGEWRGKLSTIHGAIGNLAVSRSQSNIDQLVLRLPDLQEAIQKMLDPHTAEIPFRRATYGYVQTSPPSHWVDLASPFNMTRGNDEGVNYRDQGSDLGERIWDPGYYLDVLFAAIPVRTAALTALEPAFRSTGYDRDALRALRDGLAQFIARWEQSFLLTTVVGPIDPTPDPFFSNGGHRIEHNPLNATFGSDDNTIPIGCIDPVSGIAALEPYYRDGFELRRVEPPTGYRPYWVVDNYDEAVAGAVAKRSALIGEVRARCGITRAYDLLHSVEQLILGTGHSEFVEITTPTFASGDFYIHEAMESVDLGIVGFYAGKPGESYPARRYSQFIIKKFRIPLARRTDISRIQLGYRLVVSVGGGQDGTCEIAVCEFSALETQNQDVDLFPSGARSASISASAAVVYDILQSDVFHGTDEDHFEQFAFVPAKTRLYINPRPGAVKLDVSVDFEFDINAADHPTYGFANVEVSTVARDANPNGFIVSVDVYETVIVSADGRNDTKQEQLADTMHIHFAPSFLVIGNDYFSDRAAGLATMDKVLSGISERYARTKGTIGPSDPIARVSHQAVVEQAVASFGDQLMRESPHPTQTAVRAGTNGRGVANIRVAQERSSQPS